MNNKIDNFFKVKLLKRNLKKCIPSVEINVITSFPCPWLKKRGIGKEDCQEESLSGVKQEVTGRKRGGRLSRFPDESASKR